MDRVPTTRRVVALTFDAGAGSQGVASILATLARERVPATLFLTDRWVDAEPAAAREIVTAGHLVGDHTVHHPHLPSLSIAAVRTEITTAASTIATVAGDVTAP